ncbi:MAG TPA: hypothetical protein VNO30_11765 [Kofleriaceae bacterium]|nr:hypothetical protein [Kofleriaceae bacterium]
MPVDTRPADTRIQDVQSDKMPKGTGVVLKGVVVTAIDAFGGRTGDFWIQDPMGGPYSGLHVFGAPLDQVAVLTVGDLVDIEGGEKDEFALSSDATGRTVTELKPVTGGKMMITKRGTGTLPEPVVVDALVIGQKETRAERDAEWEQWEGVPITVRNIAAFGAPAQVSSASNPDVTNKTVGVTGELTLQSALADFPMGIAADACIASATGVLDYFFNYLLYPRAPADVVMGGTSCPPKENTPELCGDGIDNDGNTFKNCFDNSCIMPLDTCRPLTPIAAIQAMIPNPPGVEVRDVYVTAVSFGKRDFWASTSPTAAANEGIYVRGPSTLDASVVPGARVSVIGRAIEFNNDGMGETLTQINRLSVPTGQTPVPMVPVADQTAATLVAAATGEPYESVLVTLTNVKVSVAGTSTNFYVGELDQNGTKFLSDDDILRLTDPVGTCYAAITGIWTYQVFDNKYGLLPISKTPGGVCP